MIAPFLVIDTLILSVTPPQNGVERQREDSPKDLPSADMALHCTWSLTWPTLCLEGAGCFGNLPSGLCLVQCSATLDLTLSLDRCLRLAQYLQISEFHSAQMSLLDSLFTFIFSKVTTLLLS
jgi:hypothetical protein